MHIHKKMFVPLSFPVLVLFASLAAGKLGQAQVPSPAEPVSSSELVLPTSPHPQAASRMPQDKAQQQERPPAGPLGTTLGVLSRRSLFFRELAHENRPLSRWQKLELAADESIAPSRLVSSAFTSGLSQARNGIPGYGQEWGGYGKRFGSSLASTAAANLFSTYLLASAFRQDPRYFVHPNATFGYRMEHAVGRMIVTPTDCGGRAFNWSGLLGALMAESLANSYLPEQERTAGKTFQRFGIRIGGSAAVNVVREYWPNIFKSLGMRKLMPESSTSKSESPSGV